jgi:hypothetical protein
VLLERKDVGAGPPPGAPGHPAPALYADARLALIGARLPREYAGFEGLAGRGSASRRSGVLSIAGPARPEWIERLRKNHARAPEGRHQRAPRGTGRDAHARQRLKVDEGAPRPVEQDGGFVDPQRTVQGLRSLAPAMDGDAPRGGGARNLVRRRAASPGGGRRGDLRGRETSSSAPARGRASSWPTTANDLPLRVRAAREPLPDPAARLSRGPRGPRDEGRPRGPLEALSEQLTGCSGPTTRRACHPRGSSTSSTCSTSTRAASPATGARGSARATTTRTTSSGPPMTSTKRSAGDLAWAPRGAQPAHAGYGAGRRGRARGLVHADARRPADHRPPRRRGADLFVATGFSGHGFMLAHVGGGGRGPAFWGVLRRGA